MTSTERDTILQEVEKQFSRLPESKKQFVLGFILGMQQVKSLGPGDPEDIAKAG